VRRDVLCAHGSVAELAVVVAAPRPDRAVRLERERVRPAPGDGDHPAAESGDLDRDGPVYGGAIPDLAVLVESPGPDRADLGQHQAVRVAGSDARHPPHPGDLLGPVATVGGAVAQLAVDVGAPGG